MKGLWSLFKRCSHDTQFDLNKVEFSSYTEAIGKPVVLPCVAQCPLHPGMDIGYLFNNHHMRVNNVSISPEGYSSSLSDETGFFLRYITHFYSSAKASVAMTKLKVQTPILNLPLPIPTDDFEGYIKNHVFKPFSSVFKNASMTELWNRITKSIKILSVISKGEPFNTVKRLVAQQLVSRQPIMSRLVNMALMFEAFVVPTILYNTQYTYMIIPSTWPQPLVEITDYEAFSMRYDLPRTRIIARLGGTIGATKAFQYYNVDKLPNCIESHWQYILESVIPVNLSIAEEKKGGLSEHVKNYTGRYGWHIRSLSRNLTVTLPLYIDKPLTEQRIPLGVTARIRLRKPYINIYGNTEDIVIGIITSVTYNFANASIAVVMTNCVSQGEADKIAIFDSWGERIDSLKQYTQNINKFIGRIS